MGVGKTGVGEMAPSGNKYRRNGSRQNGSRQNGTNSFCHISEMCHFVTFHVQ